MERHYDQRYFFAERKEGGKTWVDAEGKTHEFGYAGGGVWNFKGVYDELVDLLGEPSSVLDLGTGCGGFVSYLNHLAGIEALGLEFSSFAIVNLMPGARGYVKQWDLAATPWPVEKQYDWVTAIDLYEHVFEEDVDRIVAESKRVARHFIIAKICTAQLPHEVWHAKKAPMEQVLEQAHKEGYDWLVVSGHVLSEVPDYWTKKFQDEEWRLRPDLSDRLRRALNLPEDWRTTLIVERQPPKSDLPAAGFSQTYYDQGYFASRDGKGYRMPDGSLRRWGYMNPDGAWDGCRPIVNAWKRMFQPAMMLDAGAGRGQFLAAAREAGIFAEGFDYSEYAVGEGRYSKCQPEWLRLHDATKPWPYLDENFDFVIMTDMLEHIYRDDLRFVIDELYRVAGKWVFLQIAVAGSGGLQGTARKGFLLKKGEPVPPELEQYAVAGHVSVQGSEFWEAMLDREDWMPRRDLVEQFRGLVDAKIISNWTQNMIYVGEKLD